MPASFLPSLAVGLSQFPLRLQPKLQIAAGRSTVDLPQLLGAGSDPFVGTSGGNALLQSLFQFLNASAIGRSFGRLRQKPAACTLDFALQVMGIFNLIHRSSPSYKTTNAPKLFNSFEFGLPKRPSRFLALGSVPNGRLVGLTPMHSCRAYLFDADGHVIDRIDLTCGDDESAKARAKEFLEGHVVELWDGGSRRSSLVAKAKPDRRGLPADAR
jgi:hypothetical protein